MFFSVVASSWVVQGIVGFYLLIMLGRRFFQNADKSLPLRGLSALLLLEIALLLLVVAPSQTHTMPSLSNVRFEKKPTP